MGAAARSGERLSPTQHARVHRRPLRQARIVWGLKDASRRALAGRKSVSDLIMRYETIRAPALKSGGETMRLLRRHVEPAIGRVAIADVTGDP
jgi:hypothetical protein